MERIRRARKRRDSGFTLVELLVVIVILGILSAVVVFAVRGAGNKGRNEALATDKRVLQTAQEAFCAKYSRYATSERELVDGPPGGGGGFLSEPSELNDIEPADPNDPNDPKPCNNTGYKIVPVVTPSIPEPPDCPAPGVSGVFCLTASPPPPNEVGSDMLGHGLDGQMVQLRNGKVLAYSSAAVPDSGGKQAAFMLFDPSTETWSSAAPTVRKTSGDYSAQAEFHTMILLDGTEAECGDRCGHVLAHFGGGGLPGHWQLYDPDANSWTLTGTSAYSRGYFAEAELLTGPGCGSLCGQVLIVGRGGEPGPTGFCDNPTLCPTPSQAELYDPELDTFTGGAPHVTTPPNRYGGPNAPSLVRLPDGKVLFVEGNASQLFDPTVGSLGAFGQAVPLLLNHNNDQDPFTLTSDQAILSNGGVLATANGEGILPPRAQWYDLARGIWTETDGCRTTQGEPCQLLASLPDRTVLGVNGPFDSAKQGYLFDPATGWSATGPRKSAASRNAGVLMTRGECEDNCGKVLIAGDTAEIYTPP